MCQRTGHGWQSVSRCGFRPAFGQTRRVGCTSINALGFRAIELTALGEKDLSMSTLRLGASIFLPSTDGSRSVELIPMRLSFWATGRTGLGDIPMARCVFPMLLRLRAEEGAGPFEAEVGVGFAEWESF